MTVFNDACIYCGQAAESIAEGSVDHWVRVYRPRYSQYPVLICPRRIEKEGLRDDETLTPPSKVR